MSKRSSVRTFTIVALVVAAGALTWLAVGGLGDNLVYYWTPTELKAAPRSTACLLYTSPSPRDRTRSRMLSSA